mmetsp:Transcript_14377/g.35056  ORF Transcript_14377/g.35056 Transcript_14377/m.35056 type:complete len:180 (-) Transcript_14377:377-916(-)|eukprot:CAMPEP_0114523440 /NCGR_PEP_ID=MMETSP0109-20121206/21290_1 /TAXON_ID=29199 /ORGANISM="Chlorarachnion reptans, Strain CCCM449" /LENGTH=179 /DNA_ID=CAMNT_0001704751 /DNA_START=127 /DNA_END=666 /DNA_ORIENTATION=+
MGKSIRSKVKKKFRAVKRQHFEPVVQKRMSKSEEVLTKAIEGKISRGDTTDPYDKWLSTYGEDLDKKINDAPKNENDIDVRAGELTYDMNKKKQLTSCKALQGPVAGFKDGTTGKMDLKTALSIIRAQEAEQKNNGVDVDGDFEMRDANQKKKAKKLVSNSKVRRSKRKMKGAKDVYHF